jgi:hypothetical protein
VLSGLAEPSGEFLSALEHDLQLAGRIVNGDLRELTYPIKTEFASSR